MADDKLAAAIREAEEWLAHYDDTVAAVPPGSADPPEVRLLRALLAALPAEGKAKAHCPSCGGLGWVPDDGLQIGCVRCNGTGEAPAPQPAPSAEATPDGHGCPIEGEPGHEGCAVCGHPFPSALPPSVEAAAEDVVRGDWWGHYCPSCGSTFEHGPECRIGRLAKALDSARAAKGGAS